MYSSIQVANRFINLARSRGGALTHMQLQKLAYIAHGFYLAITNRPLLNEPVSAWTYGPVIPGMYDAFKNYRDYPITETSPEPLTAPIDPQAEAIINAVFLNYGDKNGIQLSQLTHMPETPWSMAYNGLNNTIIPNEQIRQYYQRLMTNRQGCNGL